MRFYDRRRVEKMRALPAFPRVLFDLYAFDNVDPADMARGLDTDVASIALCLAQARGMIATARLHEPSCRFDPANTGMPIVQLERDTRQQYRRWLEATMAASGYGGVIQWPELPAGEDAERDSIVALILPRLPAEVRKAVERSRNGHGITGILWRHVPPWRSAMRRHLDRLEREVRYSGWLPFHVWLADRIAPDRHYPDGLPILRIVRRPLPAEGGEQASVRSAVCQRFERLPVLTREAFFLHDRYGRTVDEITERLGIGRRSVNRRIRVALYVVLTGSPPSLRHTLWFEFNLRWARWRGRMLGAWKALRGD